MGQLLKEKLGRDELLQLLNWELAAYEACEDCHFEAIDGKPGARWSAHLEHEDDVGLTQFAIARYIVDQTARVYDLR